MFPGASFNGSEHIEVETILAGLPRARWIGDSLCGGQRIIRGVPDATPRFAVNRGSPPKVANGGQGVGNPQKEICFANTLAAQAPLVDINDERIFIRL